ncbi:hypothetical protein QFC22_002803 [Naganishia vaughanmartiniae]|uniref:Uncharacterized protein n=1 Tax=Naganishia vaughanmartiniae TaxID=1424756 RepID=A0ACC2XAQ4_9TREE|nr:hypothetical protein QFC22_002803 [Naganishia vaughanmartiniae]
MSGTSTAVSVTVDVEKSRIAGGAGVGALMDKTGKKRTSGEAELDAVGGEGEQVVHGRDWLLQKVEEMERAFKYMIDRYRKACVTWQDTKSLVQAYLEEAARNYVPPPPKEKVPSPPAQADTPTNATVARQTNGKSIPPPLALASSTTTTSNTSRAYIDPKTGLPSPTQPIIHLMDDAAAGKVDSPRVIAGNETPATGKSPRPGSGTKKSPRYPDHPASASNINNNNNNNNHLNSTQSANAAKFPTGSAGDPIEIDDLDADVQHVAKTSGVAADVDMEGEIVHLAQPPLTAKTNGQPPSAGVGDTTNVAAGATAAVQPEGIGLGLGLGLAGLGLSGLGLAGFSDTSGTGELPAELYGLQGTSNIGGVVGSNDTPVAFGADGLPAAAGGEGGTGTQGEQQISEEDLMRFFESLAPGSGTAGGGGDGVGEALQALEGGMTGDTSGGLGNAATGEENFGSTDAVVGNTAAGNGVVAAGGEAVAQPQQGDAGGMPEELDLSNLDWTQYSALLADIPDDLGGA